MEPARKVLMSPLPMPLRRGLTIEACKHEKPMVYASNSVSLLWGFEFVIELLKKEAKRGISFVLLSYILNYRSVSNVYFSVSKGPGLRIVVQICV